jgi:aryl-alcohol dehydrogenase-like predicted oxidoreductase
MVGTRPLGSTGITVGEIGLGAWQLGRSAQWADGPDEAEAVAIVRAAIDAGVTFIDTAPGYADGQSELNVGRAIAGRRDDVILCTKFGHTPDGGSDWAAEAIRPAVQRSAQRMGTDHLDVVLLHNPPAEILDGSRSEHYAVFASLVDEGLIRAYGASVDTGADVDTVLTTSDSRALEVRLSALYQEPWEAMGRAREQGVGTIVKVPLESGWLTGKYDASSRFGDVRSRWSPDEIEWRARLVKEFADLLPSGTSVLGGALQYLLSYDAVSTVIPGTKSVAQLRATLAAAAEPFGPETAAAVRSWYAERLGPAPLGW